MLDTLLLVSVLTQQSLDLIKNLVQVLGILGMNANNDNNNRLETFQKARFQLKYYII